MNSDELKQKLSELEDSKNTFVLELDKLYNSIQEAMSDKAIAWIDQEVERKITENSEQVELMGTKKLSELKSKLNQLKETVPRLVASEFKDQRKWPHHQNIKKEANSPSRDHYEEPHQHAAFRNVISKLGPLLDEFGLLKGDTGIYPTWRRENNNQFRYSISTSYGMDSDPILKKYFELEIEYKKLNDQIESTMKVYSTTKAKELWNKA